MPLRGWNRRLCALALGALAACASPEERFAEHVARAETYVAEGKPREALLEYQGALKIDPRDPQVNFDLAELLNDEGEYQAAVFHYGEAYRLDPTRVDAAMAQAMLVWFSSPRRAERLIRGALQRYPDDDLIHRTRSGLALVRRDTKTALAAARKAIELDPDDYENWVQLGTVHLSRIRELRQQKKRPPGALFREAIAAFRKVDEIEGGHVGARVEIARVYAAWPRHVKDAIAAFRDAVTLAVEQEKPTARYAAASAAEEWARVTERPRVRLWAVREMVRAAPQRVRNWDQLAQLTAEIEGPTATEIIYREMLEQQPDLPAAHIVYAAHLSRTDRTLDAIAHLDQAISDGVDEPRLWEQVLQYELYAGQLANARATYTQMAGAYPDDLTTRRAAGRLALADGRSDEAVEIFREVAAEEESFENERLLALAELQAGDLTAATTAIDRAMALASGYSVPGGRLKLSIQAEAREWGNVLLTLSELKKHGHEPTPSEQLQYARALYGTGRPESGKEALEALLEGPVVLPAAALEYARRERKSNPRVTRSYLSKALKLAPGNHDLLEAFTRLDIQTNQLQRALQRLDRVVESRLATPEILLLRAEVLARMSQLDRAEADALRAFEARPELPLAVDLLHGIYHAQGKTEQARRSFEEAEAVGVLHAGARVLLARLYAGEGKLDEAKAMYEKVVAENPRIPIAKADLAVLLARQGQDLDRALELARAAQRELPDYAYATDAVGLVHLQKGQPEAALRQFTQAIVLGRDSDEISPAYAYHAGLALSDLGRDAEAASAFERALGISEEFSGAEDARRQLEAARKRAFAEGSADDTASN